MTKAESSRANGVDAETVAAEAAKDAENDPFLEDEDWLQSLDAYFNPDAFNPSHTTGSDDTERLADELKVRELGTFLHNIVIPAFVSFIFPC